MKTKIIFLFAFCWLHTLATAQLIHSSNMLEAKIGFEQFNTLGIASFDPLQSIVPVINTVENRTVFTTNYKKQTSSGNFYSLGLSLSFGYWRSTVSNIPPNSGSTISEWFQSYVSGQYTYGYNVLNITPDLLFIGNIHSELFNEIQRTSSENFRFERQNKFGVELNVGPELMYLFPNSRWTASFGFLIPVMRGNFIQRRFLTNIGFGSTVNSDSGFDFTMFPLQTSRLELGIACFL